MKVILRETGPLEKRHQSILKWSVCAVLVGCLMLPVILHFRHTDDQPNEASDPFTGLLVDIKGFHYTLNQSGQKSLTFKADRLTLKKQKIGHIHIGGFAAVRLENAVIQIHGMPAEGATPARSQFEEMNVDQVISGINMPFPSIKRIISMTMAPIRIELVTPDSVLTRVSASFASIRSKKGGMVFEKKVRVVSGPRTLETDRLRISSDLRVVKVPGRFVLVTPDGRKTGDRLTTDIQLISISAW